ncbi:unnamed protein product, partial [Effrenium voratum]
MVRLSWRVTNRAAQRTAGLARCTGDDLKGLNEILLGNEWLNWRKNYKQWRGGGASGARGEATVKATLGLAVAATNRAQEAQELELSRRMTWSHKAELEAQGPQEEVTDQDYVFSTEEIVLSRLYEWCELAVTQRAFEWLAAQQCSPDLRRVLLGSRLSSLKKGKALGSGKGSTSLLWELLTCIRIFARMTPNGKISRPANLLNFLLGRLVKAAQMLTLYFKEEDKDMDDADATDVVIRILEAYVPMKIQIRQEEEVKVKVQRSLKEAEAQSFQLYHPQVDQAIRKKEELHKDLDSEEGKLSLLLWAMKRFTSKYIYSAWTTFPLAVKTQRRGRKAVPFLVQELSVLDYMTEQDGLQAQEMDGWDREDEEEVVEGFMSQNLMCTWALSLDELNGCNIHVSAMVGDGGNDSGALRTAHVGMALSSATSATVVAPFTTNRPSVAPIADLLREGRGALATSFAGYKYCIHYGLLNSVLKFKTYWYGIAQSMAAAYFQDLLGFLSLSWAISLARPAPSLSSNRPTSSLFSGFTVFSVMGMLLLNSFFLEVAWAYITSQEEYTPFPVHKVRITQWWKLNTNWEVTTLFFSYTFQLFWSAVVYSFGDVFRLAWHRNLAPPPRLGQGTTLRSYTINMEGQGADGPGLESNWEDLGGGLVTVVLVSVSLGFLTYLMLSGPTSLTRFFRLVFEEPNSENACEGKDITDSDPWTEHEQLGVPRAIRSSYTYCPAMPRKVRLHLLCVIMINLACTAFLEK